MTGFLEITTQCRKVRECLETTPCTDSHRREAIESMDLLSALLFGELEPRQTEEIPMFLRKQAD